jgi:hypothetical protein
VHDQPEERDPVVRHQLAVFEECLRASEAATAAWEAAALAGYQARARRAAGKQIVAVAGELREILPPGTSNRDLQQLAAAELAAEEARREAAERVVQQRQALEAARARARSRPASVSG